MKKSISSKLLLIVVIFFVMTPCQADEKVITKKELPEAVLEAFTDAYPNATVRSYAKETADGQTFYEISFEDQGKKIDILYMSDGNVAVLEETISLEELPAQVQKAIIAEKVTEDGEMFFEIKIADENHGKWCELKYSSDGKLIQKVIKKTDDNDEEENEKD
jgi:hypothetical protein